MSISSFESRYHDIVSILIMSYSAALPKPASSWPVDVRVLLMNLNEHLFETGLKIYNIRKELGLLDNNISSRFAKYVGQTPQKYRNKHQIELSKIILHKMKKQPLKICEVAAYVGYENHTVFSTIFKQKVGCSPSAYKTVINQLLKEKT